MVFCCVRGRPRICAPALGPCAKFGKFKEGRWLLVSNLLSEERFQPHNLNFVPPPSNGGLVHQEAWAGRGVAGGKFKTVSFPPAGLILPLFFLSFSYLFPAFCLPCPPLKSCPPSPPASGPGLRRTAPYGSASSGSRSTPPPRPRGLRGPRAMTSTGEWRLPAAHAREGS